MRFTELRLSGAFLVELEPHFDERGFFARTFCEEEFAAHGLPRRFPQCNLSRSRHRGTLRGMHFEAPPSLESKLVSCTAGSLYDVIVDLRPGSPTRLQWVGVELSATAAQGLFVPAGFAHGFLTMVDNTDATYHMGDSFHAGRARGFRWNDPAVGIVWPFAPTTLSERDQSHSDLDLPG